MSRQNKELSELSHVRKYFLTLQDAQRGFVLAVFFVSFVTLAAGINGELNVFALMMIWSVGLPGIILIFRWISLLAAKYNGVPGTSILYSGNYDDLVIKLFNAGFCLQSKVDDYYQFRSSLPFMHRHILTVKKEDTQYHFYGEAGIIAALSKDIKSDNLKIDIVNTKTAIEENKRGNKFKNSFKPKKAATKQNDITG